MIICVYNSKQQKQKQINMSIKEIDSIAINGKVFYNFVESCLVLDLTPSNMRYCVPDKELVVEGGVEYISEDGLWRNLYRQSKQYYKDLEVKRIIDTTNALF